MFLLDANLVRNLELYSSRQRELPASFQEFLRVSRRQIGVHWHSRSRYIPVNPVLAVAELSKQDLAPDREAFELRAKKFFGQVYGLDDYDPAWFRSVYANAMTAVVPSLWSLTSVVDKTLELYLALDKSSDAGVEEAVCSLLTWAWDSQDWLQSFGGPPLLVAVYAFAGSPDAERILKVTKVGKQGRDVVARNVAWDFAYWTCAQIEYLRAQYQNTIVCTSDEAFADLLGRFQHASLPTERLVDLDYQHYALDGELTPFKLRRLEGTGLADRIGEMLRTFFVKVATTNPSFNTYGLNQLVE